MIPPGLWGYYMAAPVLVCHDCHGHGRSAYLAAPGQLAPCLRCAGTGQEPRKVRRLRFVGWLRVWEQGKPAWWQVTSHDGLKAVYADPEKARQSARHVALQVPESDGAVVVLPEGFEPVV